MGSSFASFAHQRRGRWYRRLNYSGSEGLAGIHSQNPPESGAQLEKFEFARVVAIRDRLWLGAEVLTENWAGTGARDGREHRPAQASFLTAAEAQRRFPSRGFWFSHLLAGPLSTHLDYAPNGPTGP